MRGWVWLFFCGGVSCYFDEETEGNDVLGGRRLPRKWIRGLCG